MLRSCFTDVGDGAWSDGLDQYHAAYKPSRVAILESKDSSLCHGMARRQERKHEYAVPVDQRQSKRAVWISATYRGYTSASAASILIFKRAKWWSADR